ncbi:hypothetical protein BGZ80_006875, partial [Entomortierella chlamydospora]
TAQEREQHINWKELKCIWLVVNLPQSKGRTVNIISDNQTAIAYINKFGGTKSQAPTRPNNKDMETLSEDGDTPQDDIRSLIIQSGGRPITADDGATGMVDSPRLLPETRQDAGSP